MTASRSASGKTAKTVSVNDATRRAWQRMLSGRRLDLLDPSPLDIEIEDIAHGLARVARWNGQTGGDHIFSVAQHTLLTEEIARRRTGGVDRRLAIALLLHDAPEYVIGDMISPFKVVMGGAYKAVEHRLLNAIHVPFELPPRTCRVKSWPSSRPPTAAPRFWRRRHSRGSAWPRRGDFSARAQPCRPRRRRTISHPGPPRRRSGDFSNVSPNCRIDVPAARAASQKGRCDDPCVFVGAAPRNGRDDRRPPRRVPARPRR